jgi:rhamnogalacturonyl hydrolase YesR
MQLFDYCRRNDWAGYDPYDALNSRVFASTPFSKSKVCRIAFTQILKRVPINLRPILAITKEQNPKAIALFLMASLKLSRLGLLENQEIITSLAESLTELRSPDSTYWCWGYSFPWQTRTVLVPRGAPNLVCTVFVANALLNLYEWGRESRFLGMAISAAEYILNELYWSEGNTACFSYPLASSRARVHNANFLGAALLCRVHKLSSEKKFLDPAMKVARYSTSRQHEDGGWNYGELPTQRWIDNFHTGYNLCALRSICRDAGTTEFESHIRSGFEFFKKNFFRQDGAPGYFHNRLYPIDIHSVAQSIITLLELADLNRGNIDLAKSVFSWAMQNMWDEHGYFHYQKFPYFTSKVSYMRWSQAWMFLALSSLLVGFSQHIPS